MKKFKMFALIAAMVFCFVSLAGCQAEKYDVETYTRSYAYYEDGRQGDVIDGVVCDLTFISDTEYLYAETTVIAHIDAGRQVTNWTYYMKGTYTVGTVDNDEMTKEITLSAPTSGTMVMNGAVTTSEEDAEILSYNFPKNIVINYSSNVFEAAE